MATPCIDDTNSVDLTVNSGTGHLSAAVRRDGAGAIAESASGIKVSLATNSGLEIASNTLRVNTDDGLVLGTDGLQKLNIAATIGWQPGDADDSINHATNVARGATAVITNTLTVNLANTGATAQIFFVHSTTGVRFQTTYGEFETSSILDTVYISMYRSLNGGTEVPTAQCSLLTSRQYVGTMLAATETVSVPANTTYTYAMRIKSIGGSFSGTATQGHVQWTYYRGVTAFH